MEAREAVVVGASRKFECQVVGYPPPTIRWFKDESEITHDARYKFSHEARDGTVSMHIDNIRLSDAGLYKCRAENCEGYAVTAAHLTVKAAESKQPSSSTSSQSTELPAVTTEASEGTVKMKIVQEVFQKAPAAASEPAPSSRRRPLTMQSSIEAANTDVSNSVVQTAPNFIKKPESVEVSENESATLTCRVQGVPKPVITWFHQGRVLQADGLKSFSSSDDEHCLLIGRCTAADAGEYTCTATNAAGAVYCSFTLTVADALSEEGSSSDSEYSSSSYRRLSAVVEEESSTETFSDKPPREFLREMIVNTQYVDSGKKITFKSGDTVEVLDTAKSDRWLVRSKKDSLQVGYIPRSCLGESAVHTDTSKAKSLNASGAAEEAEDEDALKSGTRKRDEKQQKTQGSRKTAENGANSSEDEASSPDADVYPTFVAIADYESDELKVCEGQFLEVIDKSNPISWLVRTKPTKNNASRIGMMPASYLEVKDGVGHVDRRSTREVFREDIIQITDKQTEASVKRRYALAELLESERDYIADLGNLIEKLREDQSTQLPEKDRVLEELLEFLSFHKESFLPDLEQCAGVPADVADAFLSWKTGKSAPDAARLPECFETPLAHIRKYQTLLKDFIRYTARSGGDCEKLEKALNLLLYVTKCVDDQDVLQKLKDCPTEVLAQKPLLRHESVIVSYSDEDTLKGKERHLFLFPESLVVTRLLKTASQCEEYQYKESLELKNIRLNDSVSSDDKKFELFYVTDEGHNDMFVMQTKSDFSKEAWLRDLENMLRAQGVEKCYVTEQERSEILKKKEAHNSTLSITKQSDSTAAATAASKSAAVASGKQPAALDYSTGTETEQYTTAAESEVSSSYCTAQESADDSNDSGDSGNITPRTLEVPRAPFFVEELTPVVPDDGTFAKFECAIGGYPLPNVNWYFQGQPIKEDGHYTMSVNNQKCTMIIHDLTVEDAGLYIIEATNAHGKVSCKAELKVDPPGLTASVAAAADAAVAAADSSEVNVTDAGTLTAKDGNDIGTVIALDSLATASETSNTHTGACGSAGPEQSAEECGREGDRPKMSISQAAGSEGSTFNQQPAGSLLPDKESVGSTSTNGDGEQEDEKEMNDEKDASDKEEKKSAEDRELKGKEPKKSDEISKSEVEVQRSAATPVLAGEDQRGSHASTKSSSVDEAAGTAMSRLSVGDGCSAAGTDNRESHVAASSSSVQLDKPIPDAATSAAAIFAASPADAVDSFGSDAGVDDATTSTEQQSQEELDDNCKSPVSITVSAEDRGDKGDSLPAVGVEDETDEEDTRRSVDADAESREQGGTEQGKPVGSTAESCAGEDDGRSSPSLSPRFSRAAPLVTADGREPRPSSMHPSGVEGDDETLRRRTSPSEQTRHYYSRANADASIEIPNDDGDADDAYGFAVGGRGHKRDSRRSGAVQRSTDDEPADAPRRPRRAATAEPMSRGDRLAGLARQGQRGSSHGPGVQESRITRSHSPEIQSATLAFPLHKLPPSVRLRLTAEDAYQSTVAMPSAQLFSWHKQPAPPSPISEKPEIKQAGADQIVLFWLPPESHKDKELNISYIVEYRTAADSDWRRLGRSIRESFVKLDLPIRQTQYRIRAENEYGYSDPSLFVTGPWKKPKEVDYGFEVTVPSYLAVPPPANLSHIRAAVRRARARSCDRLTAGRYASTPARSSSGGAVLGSAEWLLNVSHHQQQLQQQSAITVAGRRSRSSEREGSYSVCSPHSPTPSSESHHLSRRGHAPLLPTTLRRRLCDLEQEMTSEVESILGESCFRVTTAARSRFERYRSRSECRQTTSLAAHPSRNTAWGDDSTLTLFGNRAASQKRLVMPSAVQRRLGSELRDQAVLPESQAYGSLRNYDPSNTSRLEPSYLSSYSRESDYEYADIARLGIQRGRAAYQAEKWTRQYYSSPDSTSRASPSSLRSSVGASGHGLLSPPATSDLFELRSSRHGSRGERWITPSRMSTPQSAGLLPPLLAYL